MTVNLVNDTFVDMGLAEIPVADIFKRIDEIKLEINRRGY